MLPRAPLPQTGFSGLCGDKAGMKRRDPLANAVD
jgi:hypothetical protein